VLRKRKGLRETTHERGPFKPLETGVKRNSKPGLKGGGGRGGKGKDLPPGGEGTSVASEKKKKSAKRRGCAGKSLKILYRRIEGVKGE